MIDGQVAVNDLLEVGANVPQAEMQTLKRLKLRGDASGKSANGDVTYIAQKMFDADFFGFFGFDAGGGVDKGSGCGGAVLFSETRSAPCFGRRLRFVGY